MIDNEKIIYSQSDDLSLGVSKDGNSREAWDKERSIERVTESLEKSYEYLYDESQNEVEVIVDEGSPFDIILIRRINQTWAPRNLTFKILNANKDKLAEIKNSELLNFNELKFSEEEIEKEYEKIANRDFESLKEKYDELSLSE